MGVQLKIGYFADGIWSHNAFKLIIQDPSIYIAFICVRSDSSDKILRDYAKKYGIDVLTHNNINSIEFLKQVSAYQCDLFVSMSFNQIFKKEILNLTTYGIINCHAGKLPFYRGRNVLNWVLINDEKEFGVTVHFIDQGVDTGDIIKQKIYPITDEDDYSTLLNLAQIECASTLYESILLFKQGNLKRLKQQDIHPLGLYCCTRLEGDEIIDWKQTSRELFNFIRAICPPGPSARTWLKGVELKINQSSLIQGALVYKGVCGQVIGKSAAGLVVKTIDSSLLVTKFEYDGVIRVGDRLGNKQ